MFYVLPSSISYLETSRGMAFTARLYAKGSDEFVGIIENAGQGGCTVFNAADQRAHELVVAFVKTLNVQHEENVLDTYMDLAEGCDPLYPKLATKLTSS